MPPPKDLFVLLILFTMVSPRLLTDSSRICPVWPMEEFTVHFRVGETCYYSSSLKTNWFEGNTTCSKRNGKLAKIESQILDDLLAEKLPGFNGQCYWIGAIELDGDLKWTDGSPVFYTDFDFFRYKLNTWPNEDCVALCQTYLTENEALWEKRYCTKHFSFLCQLDAVKTDNGKLSEEKDLSVRFQKRQKTQVATEVSSLSGIRLLSKPDSISRSQIPSLCIRTCTNKVNRCVVFNFNKKTFECNGYVSKDVIFGPTKDHEHWETWKIG